MFFNTFCIAPCWLATALRKVEAGGNLTPDKRGKHQNRPRVISHSTKVSVRRHINQLAKVHSHYTRAKTKREYLENGLSISKLHKMYKEWAQGEGLTKFASKRQYRDVFNTEFNIVFSSLKKIFVPYARNGKNLPKKRD